MLKKDHFKRLEESKKRFMRQCEEMGIELNLKGPSFVNQWTLCPEPIDPSKIFKKLFSEEAIKNNLKYKLEGTIFEDNSIEIVKDQKNKKKMDIYLLNDHKFTPEQFDELLDRVWELFEEFKEFDLDFHVRDV